MTDPVEGQGIIFPLDLKFTLVAFLENLNFIEKEENFKKIIPPHCVLC